MVRRTKREPKLKPIDWRNPEDFRNRLSGAITQALGSYKRSFSRPMVLSSPGHVGTFVEARCTTDKLREYIQWAHHLHGFANADARSLPNSPVSRTVTPYFDGGVLPSQTHNLMTNQMLPFIVCDPDDDQTFAVFEVRAESFIPSMTTTYWRSYFSKGASETWLTKSEYARLDAGVNPTLMIPAFNMQREHFDSSSEYESCARELLEFAQRYTSGVMRAINAMNFVHTVFDKAQTTRSVFKMFAGFQALCRMFEIPDDIIAAADRPSSRLIDQLNTTELRRVLPDWADSWLDHRELLSAMATVHRTMRAESHAAPQSLPPADIESILYVGD